MDQGTIAIAYAPFVALLREGPFAVPADGWPAELVAAHVARNNDLIADAAERVIAGEQPTYDNRPVVDDAALRAYADAVGGITGLAAAVETSARRLAAARAALDSATEGYLLPVNLVHEGHVVTDEPVPIGEFIEGNASFHLKMHLEQLEALRR